MSTTTSTPRPSVVQLAIKEKGALYAAYIPLFTEGGMFIPTTRDYQLGEDIYVLLVEHLKLYDPTGTRKDPKAALFAMFKKWQKQAGIQNPRFGFSGKKKA